MNNKFLEEYKKINNVPVKFEDWKRIKILSIKKSISITDAAALLLEKSLREDLDLKEG